VKALAERTPTGPQGGGNLGVAEATSWLTAGPPWSNYALQSEPLTVTVRPDTVKAQQRTSFTITATNSSGQPVNGTISINQQVVGQTNQPFTYTFHITFHRIRIGGANGEFELVPTTAIPPFLVQATGHQPETVGIDVGPPQ